MIFTQGSDRIYEVFVKTKQNIPMLVLLPYSLLSIPLTTLQVFLRHIYLNNFLPSDFEIKPFEERAS